MKRVKWLVLSLLVPVVGCVLAAGMARGENALLVLDQFVDYNNGPLRNQGQGFGWDGDWAGSGVVAVTNTPSLTHPSLNDVVAGGHALIGDSGSEWITARRKLETPLTDGPYYLGFLMDTGESDQMHARVWLSRDLSPNDNYQVGAGIWDGKSTWRLIRRDGGDNWGDITSGVTVSSETTYFVIRLENDGRWQTALFVNPADADALRGTPQATFNFGSASASESFSFLEMQRRGENVGLVQFDEVRIGTTPESMFSPPPRPSATVLIVM